MTDEEVFVEVLLQVDVLLLLELERLVRQNEVIAEVEKVPEEVALVGRRHRLRLYMKLSGEFKFFQEVELTPGLRVNNRRAPDQRCASLQHI